MAKSANSVVSSAQSVAKSAQSVAKSAQSVTPAAQSVATPARSEMSSVCPSPPRLASLTKWDNFPGYGFNLHAEKARAGEAVVGNRLDGCNCSPSIE